MEFLGVYDLTANDRYGRAFSRSHLVLDNYSPFLGNAILISVPGWQA
jgi:hypothetical protein